MTYPITTAHYFAGRGRKFVTIVPAGQPFTKGVEVDVDGKKDAHRVALWYCAKPWNF